MRRPVGLMPQPRRADGDEVACPEVAGRAVGGLILRAVAYSSAKLPCRSRSIRATATPSPRPAAPSRSRPASRPRRKVVVRGARHERRTSTGTTYDAAAGRRLLLDSIKACREVIERSIDAFAPRPTGPATNADTTAVTTTTAGGIQRGRDIIESRATRTARAARTGNRRRVTLDEPGEGHLRTCVQLDRNRHPVPAFLGGQPRDAAGLRSAGKFFSTSRRVMRSTTGRPCGQTEE